MTLRFLHPPRTGGRSLARAWDLSPPEYLGHAPPTSADFRYGLCRNPWDRAVSLWCLIRDSAGPFRNWVLDGLPSPPDYVPIATPCAYWLRTADWVGRFERWTEDVAELARILDRPVPALHVGQSVRRPYPEYYDDETRRIIEVVYAEDIELWDYRF